jgi:hypothetical protein
MKFHKDRENRFHPIRPSQIDAPPSRNAKFVELLSQEDGIADDSPMITACYETHVSMERMLAAFAELRGDDAEDAIG